MINTNKQRTESRPPYLLGLLGMVPLVGFFVGLGLILYGILKYKDKKLLLIGICCILFTVFVYSSLFYYGFKSESGKKAWAQMAQLELNSLVKNVEYFKLVNGHYPDSLQQVVNKDEFVSISDPLRSIEKNKNINFTYKNLGNKYLLFSSGIDGIANTNDDIYPTVDTSNKHIGWIKSK